MQMTRTLLDSAFEFVSRNRQHLILSGLTIGGFFAFGEYTTVPVVNFVNQLLPAQLGTVSNSLFTRISVSVIEGVLYYGSVFSGAWLAIQPFKARKLEKQKAELEKQNEALEKNVMEYKAKETEFNTKVEELSKKALDLFGKQSEFDENVRQHQTKVANTAKNFLEREKLLEDKENELNERQKLITEQENNLQTIEQSIEQPATPQAAQEPVQTQRNEEEGDFAAKINHEVPQVGNLNSDPQPVQAYVPNYAGTQERLKTPPASPIPEEFTQYNLPPQEYRQGTRSRSKSPH
ncbi:MAG: hypothetical protein JSS07_08080 [Proteobacteria bacterium]|nr:hypothetical protein [Pseudomonadota bacterium]